MTATARGIEDPERGETEGRLPSWTGKVVVTLLALMMVASWALLATQMNETQDIRACVKTLRYSGTPRGYIDQICT